jgi:AcrR family transcriptional regulator
MSHHDLGFRERKRQATSSRITAAAARLALEQGLADTTVDQISEEAEVGRATFFRYFDTKERAVAEGFTGVWLQMILDALERQSPGLPALNAVQTAFAELAGGFGGLREIALSQAQLSRSSPALNAWTLQVYTGYEQAIAEVVAPRFGDIAANDPRPRLVGALVMASIRLALDDWVAAGGQTDLAALIDRNLNSVSISSSNMGVLAAAGRDDS